MDTGTLLLLGAAGGAVRGIVHAYDCMTAWLSGRRQHQLLAEPPPEGPPAFGAFYDVGGESIAAVVHTLLGAGVAVLLGASGQVSGGFAVFAAGASAPLVLVQLKNSRLAEAILGDTAMAATTAQTVDTASGNGLAPRLTGEPAPRSSTQLPQPTRSEPPSGLPRQAADQDGAL